MISDIRYARDVLAGAIVVSGGQFLGTAMNDAKAGNYVSISTNGIFNMPTSEYETEAEIGTREYKVPTINMEVPKIELD